jgi:hypothetical protein
MFWRTTHVFAAIASLVKLQRGFPFGGKKQMEYVTRPCHVATSTVKTSVAAGTLQWICMNGFHRMPAWSRRQGGLCR